jgi:serine/threonine protein kinase
MAPEVYRHEDYNETVDIYSYAMILFYLLVGRPPWPTLPGLEAVRKASTEGDRPNIPRDMDIRMQNLLKECWDDNASVRPSFDKILDALNFYSSNVFHTDTNMVSVADQPPKADLVDNGCDCVIL